MANYIITILVAFFIIVAQMVVGVGVVFVLVWVSLTLGFTLATEISTALFLNSIIMILAYISFAEKRPNAFNAALPIVIVSSFLSPLGARVVERLPRELLLSLFVGFSVFAGSMLLFYLSRERQVESDTKKLLAWGVGLSSFVGFLGSLLGVGVASFIVPVWLGFNPKRASATTGFIVILFSITGFLGNTALGPIKIHL